MHVKVLSQWLANQLVIGHASRAAALLRAVGAVLTGGKLSLTHIGRNLGGSAHVKHQIKAVDRLLGNRHLCRERQGIYRAIVQTLLLGNKRPVVVVDWSDPVGSSVGHAESRGARRWPRHLAVRAGFPVQTVQ